MAVAAAGAAAAPVIAVAGGANHDPVRFLVWLSMVSAGAGYLAGALGAGFLYGVVAPGVWMVVLVLVDGLAAGDVPTPFWAALCWTGLFLGGAGLGRIGRRAPWTGAGALLLLGALATGLPGRGGLGDRPWPPAAARVLLESSPATIVVESAGVDWMRHPLVYDAVGTDRFERMPYRGSLAGPLVLLVGCLLSAVAAVLERRRTEE